MQLHVHMFICFEGGGRIRGNINYVPHHLPDRLPEMFKHANHLATKSYVQKYPKEQYTTKRKSNIYSKKKIITNINE